MGQGDTLADDAVAQYCALLGLDEFTDWQYPDWGTAVRDFGAAGYSETAQVYAVANASGYSVTLSAASMTPQTFAALNTNTGGNIMKNILLSLPPLALDPDSLRTGRSGQHADTDCGHGSRSSPRRAAAEGIGSDALRLLTAAADGVYYQAFNDWEINYTDTMGRALIYAIDEQTGDARPVCSLPGCAHDSAACPAWSDGNVTALLRRWG